MGGERPLAGRRVVVLGAGGTGRALAFGAQQRGATVVVANRCVPADLCFKQGGFMYGQGRVAAFGTQQHSTHHLSRQMWADQLDAKNVLSMRMLGSSRCGQAVSALLLGPRGCTALSIAAQ